MSDATSAIFISYAREDSVAADRIAEALRSHGIEVWFDQNELRGGEAWDQKIRGQIRTCSLLIPIVSVNTQGRGEGYFRREWKLAAERTHDMAAGIPFLVPVVIDDTAESAAMVPDEFMKVQWTRLPAGRTTPQFAAQIKRLLETPRAASPTRPAFPVAAPAAAPKAAASPKAPRATRFPNWAIALAVLVLGAIAFLALRRFSPDPGETLKVAKETKAAAPTPIAPNPLPVAVATALSEKSIAVLPFANLSTEKENEFFADGVQDDVITNLAKIRDLTVISRTSTLAYRDAASRNVKKIAAELGVANILEGSVRRVGSKVHMNAQLIDARTDAHLWADTFDGDASDIFGLQADLAKKIAAALKATLTTSERTLIERRPTQNQEAYDLFQRAWLLDQALLNQASRENYEPVLTLYEQAITKDPGFALAWSTLSILHGRMFWFGNVDPTPARRERARAALEEARRLAPNAPETHVALGSFAYRCDNDWRAALAEYALAAPSLPNDALLISLMAIAHRRLGQWQEARIHMERSVALNPRDASAVNGFVETVFTLRHYDEARKLATRGLETFPDDDSLRDFVSLAQFTETNDRAARARDLAVLNPNGDNPDGRRGAYLVAMQAGDLVAAERALAAVRSETFVGLNSAIVEPVALRRAGVAYLRGQREAAEKSADEAIAFYRTRSWSRRQQTLALLGIAEAEAFAGRAEAAVRDALSAVEQYRSFDAYTGIECERTLVQIYAVLGRNEEALALMRKVIASPEGTTPAEWRCNPFFARLRDDPRFEEILKSAKPL